jgi:hypothetical protein
MKIQNFKTIVISVGSSKGWCWNAKIVNEPTYSLSEVEVKYWSWFKIQSKLVAEMEFELSDKLKDLALAERKSFFA